MPNPVPIELTRTSEHTADAIAQAIRSLTGVDSRDAALVDAIELLATLIRRR